LRVADTLIGMPGTDTPDKLFSKPAGPMRLTAFFLLAMMVAACGSGTPDCADERVLAQLRQSATGAIEDAVIRADPKAKPSAVMSRLDVALTGVSVAAHDKSIDKWTCSAELRVKLPEGIARLNSHPAFKRITKAEIASQGDEIVAPIAYTVYQTREKKELMVSAEGLEVPARFIQGAQRVGAFALDLRTPPDLRAGLSLYSGHRKQLFIEPDTEGRLRFQINYDNPACRPWMQHITEERGGTLIYDNQAARCSVTFSIFGELVLAEHKGCELMPERCLPGGAYRRQ
jgi:hypothetical protein